MRDVEKLRECVQVAINAARRARLEIIQAHRRREKGLRDPRVKNLDRLILEREDLLTRLPLKEMR